MKIVCFNINSIRARMHQIKAIIDKHDPDVIGLQETKVQDSEFPIEEVESLGYYPSFHGQKGHYGVAILTKKKPISVQKGFETDEEDAQRRMIMVTLLNDNEEQIKILNGYFPQGESQSHEIKFPAKRKFYADLLSYLQQHEDNNNLVIVMGDLNISHQDKDIGIGEQNRKRWLRTGKCSFLPEEREWLNKLLSWGLYDSFRVLHPDETEKYSWFDYRSKGFDDNRGLRIDAILCTNNVINRLKDADIDYDIRGLEKPSDHAPIWLEISN